MRFPTRTVLLAPLLIVAWLTPSLSAGREPGADPAQGPGRGLKAQTPAQTRRVVLDIPSFEHAWIFRVAEVRPEGVVRIEVRPEFANPRLTITEGYYVMAADPEKSPGHLRLFRAQVNEVAAGPTLLVTVGPEVAKQLRAGAGCELFRPVNATTAQLRDLPAIIPLGARPADTRAAQLAAHRAVSIVNLKWFAIALNNFQIGSNHLPPAVIYGPDGKPWHSWRVLLLPYLEQGELFKEYDFSQPWDGPKNIKLLDKMPDVYRDPVYGDARGHFTHYAVLVGAWKERFQEVHTAFPPWGVKMKDATQSPFELLDQGAPRSSDATDGPNETIAIVPVAADRKIPWTKPEDILVGPDFPGLGKPGGIAAPYPTGEDLEGPRSAPVLMLDFKVVVLLDTIKPNLLRAMTTRDGRNAGVLVEEVDFFQVPFVPLPQPKSAKERILKIRIDGAQAQAWVE